MADKNLNSITFPGLSDKYKINQIANEYSSSSTYAVGDIVNHLGTTYRCTTAISTAEAWTAGHWTEVKVANEVTDLKSAVNDTTYYLSDMIGEKNFPWIFGYIGTNTTNFNPETITASTTIKHCVVDCQAGDVFMVNARGGSTSRRPWSFVDSSNNVLLQATSNVQLETYLVAPTNAVKLVCNSGSNNGVWDCYCYKNGNRLVEIENNIESVINGVSNTTNESITDWEQGSLKVADGNITSSTIRCRTVNYIAPADENCFLIKVNILSGYKVALRRYLKTTNTFVDIPFSFETGTVYIHHQQEYKYKFIIGKLDDSTLTPSDLPSGVLTCNYYSPICTNDVLDKIKSEQIQQHLYGDFQLGAWRTDEPYSKLNNRPWKARSVDYMAYPYDIELTASDGYVFYFQTLDDYNQFIYNGKWKCHYAVIPKNTKFVITIQDDSDPEDNTIVASPDLYKTKVVVKERVLNSLNWFALMKDRVHFQSHRGWVGDTANYPENSIPSFVKAGQMGAWSIETDIRETTDNYFVLMHDDTIDRTTDGTGAIDSMTYAETQSVNLIGGDGTLKIPTLEQFLAQCRIYGCVGCIEIKGLQNGYESFLRVRDIVFNYGMENNVMFTVHYKKTYDYVRRNFPHVPIHFMTESDDLWPNYTDYLNAMECLGNSVCSLRSDDFSENAERVKSIHNKKLLAIKSSSSWEAQKSYLGIGIDIISSNNNLIVS